MKRRIALLLAISLLFSLAFVPVSYAGPRHYGGGHRHYGDGYYAAGALIGGLLLGTVIGSAISQPVYTASRPAYACPAPATEYAYPPDGGIYYREEPPGEWVTVPGKWVNGKWVPTHRVWVPLEP